MTENGRAAVATLREFLAGMPFEAREDDQGDVVDFHMDLEGPAPDVVARVFVPTERFAVFFNYEDAVPQELLPQVSLFIMLANYGTLIGGFEMDLKTGHLRYKSAIDFTATPLTELLIRNAMLCAMETMELFSEHLFAVLDGTAHPDEAYRAALADEAEWLRTGERPT